MQVGCADLGSLGQSACRQNVMRQDGKLGGVAAIRAQTHESLRSRKMELGTGNLCASIEHLIQVRDSAADLV